MRSHFKPGYSRWTPNKISRHVVGRGGTNENFRQTLINPPAERAFRRRMRGRSARRFAEIVYSHTAIALSAHMHAMADRPGFLRQIMDPEGCRRDKVERLRKWVIEKRTAPRVLKYHAHPSFTRIKNEARSMHNAVQLITGRLSSSADCIKVEQ